MTITRRCLVLCGLLAVLVACGGDSGEGKSGKDYRAMTPAEVCELLPTDDARDLMKDIADEPLTASEEISVKLPVCRYGSGDGKPYLTVSIHQTSQLEEGGDVTAATIAGQKGLQRDSDGSCSAFIPLEENLYLLAIVESWDPGKDTCPVARDALEAAYPKLTG